MTPGSIEIVDDDLTHKPQIVVRCAPHVAIKLYRLFTGSRRAGAGEFVMSATPANARELEWFMGRYPFEIAVGSRVRFNALVATDERRQMSILELEGPDYVPRDFDLALPPRDYQRVAADLALRTGALLIADDLGLGKTVSAICALAGPGQLPAVVVTMTHLTRQWDRELSRFLPAARVHRVRTGKPYPLDKIRFETRHDGRRLRVATPGVPDVVVLNYEKLDGWADALGAIVKTLVFDEVQELRHHGTNKYNAAVAIAAEAKTRIGLSATPIYNYGAEIYSVVNAIAPMALGDRSEFYREWCSGEGAGFAGNKVCVRDPAALGTYLRESGLMIRRTRRDVGRELPPLQIVRHTVDVEMDRINEAVADVAEIARRVLDRAGNNFELMKWSGEIDYRMRQATGIGKAPAVADFVRLLVESGVNVVLYGWHRTVYDLWSSAFDRASIPYAMYTGEESEPAKAESARRFIAGEVRVIVISLRAGAGLDGLQHVDNTAVVFGELDWSPKVHEQDIGRVYRDGQKNSVFAYYLTADEGSDPVISDVLGIKDAQSTGIISPELATEAVLVGASSDHIKKLAADIVRRHPSADHGKAPT